ncbi:MAG: hypothetical protein OZ928_21115 [Polyangiaceae bacterium]|nr:hypothetical protein [Polyangiaceae bacterium]
MGCSPGTNERDASAIDAAIDAGTADSGADGAAIDAGTADSGADGAAIDAGTADSGADGAAVRALRVLFIGNSYTYVNDLPTVLSNLAATAGVPPLIAVESVTTGGASFEDHLAAGVAVARIEQGTWTHVVLQDQSVTPTLHYFNVFDDHFSEDADAAKSLGDHVAAAGAVPVWYATWARAAGNGYYATFGIDPARMQDLLTSAYARFAEALPGSVMACVGEAFRRSLSSHPEIVLHQADGSHPTMAGTYLTASTIYVALTGRQVPEASAVPVELGAAEAAALREVARVGSTCAGYRAPASIRMDFNETFVAGAPQRRFLEIESNGDATTGLSDGQTLAAPFSWSSGSFPGYDDPRLFFATPPCGAQLAPWKSCSIALSFSGAQAGMSKLTIALTGAYQSQVAVDLRGETTDQPLLELTRDPSSTGGTIDPLEAVVTALRGETAVAHFFLTNVGGATATTFTGSGIGDTSFNDAFWSWGTSADPSALFPGGTGTRELDWHPWPYCTDTLDAGETCVITASFTPPLRDAPPSAGYWGKTLRIKSPFAAPNRARASLQGYALAPGP